MVISKRKKKIKSLPPSLKISHLAQKLIRVRYVPLDTIDSIFNLNKEQFNKILSLIMQFFWEGKFNLFTVPNLSGLRKKKYSKKKEDEFDEPELANRELMRSLLLPAGLGKHHMYKDQLININDFLELVDGDEANYALLKEKKWDFYCRRIKDLEKKYLDAYSKSQDELTEYQRLVAEPIEEVEENIQYLKIIEIMGLKDYRLLILLKSLCIQYSKLIHLIMENHGKNKSIDIFSGNDLQCIEKSIERKDSKHNNRDLIKKDIPLRNDFIYTRSLEFKRRNPEKSKLEVAGDIKDKFSLKLKPKSILRIIQQENSKREKQKKRDVVCLPPLIFTVQKGGGMSYNLSVSPALPKNITKDK